MKILLTVAFKQMMKKLHKEHQKRALQELSKALELINNEGIESHMDNHPLSNANGLKDIHLDGGNLILLYKYVHSDTLVISAKLHNIVNHDQLHTPGVFDERPAKEYGYEEVQKIIKGSFDIENKIDYYSIELWVHEFYNSVISKVLLLDDIYITDLKDFGDFVRCTIIGTQYDYLVPIEQLREIKPKLRKTICSYTTDYFDMFYFDCSDTYPDEEGAYDVGLVFDIPLE